MHPIALALAAVVCLGGHYAGTRPVAVSHGASHHGVSVEEPDSDNVSIAADDHHAVPSSAQAARSARA